MRKAGASEAEFPTKISHWKYAQFSVRNAEIQQGMVRARRIEAYAPQSGDIVHVNRTNGKVRFDRIFAGGYLSESGVVVDIVPGKARIVTGNHRHRRFGFGYLRAADSEGSKPSYRCN
jgi:hypothetical protein